MKKLADYAAVTGPIAVLVTLTGWLVAGMLPLPMGPGESTADIVAFFVDDANRVKAGFVISSIGVVLMLPMLALISLHLYRMDRANPLLAFLQLVTAAATMVINMFPQLIFAIAAFRTDRDPGDIVLLNDLAWLMLFTGIAPFMVQNVAIGIAILRDTTATFPRWVAWLNFFVAFSFIPDVLAFFFKTGPFAWNGIFVFWLALTTYTVFLFVMSWACRRANHTLVLEPTLQGA
ncbi:hypothetical protein ACOACQ_12025 [Nocardioides sp. CPCC 206347]|uniref:hypothetical protein n=1 Tax=unclassified Nocardioides TaxID=2615069 RepID=UPI0036192257